MQIREELRANGIDVYPQKEFDEDAEDRLINDKIRVGSLWRAPTETAQRWVSSLDTCAVSAGTSRTAVCFSRWYTGFYY